METTTDGRHRPVAIALVGCGAIGQAVIEALGADRHLAVTQVVVNDASLASVSHYLARHLPLATVGTRLDPDAGRPDLIVECAGHSALAEHVVPALAGGVPAIVASVGALHDPALRQALEAAAEGGGVRLTLVSGAIAAIDALAAARLGGLDSVHYTGRKPPRGWLGTAAAERVDLLSLTEATVVFDGSAGEAARRFPQNANVAATVSLAGLGLEATRATLIADPAVTSNVHSLVVEGGFGRFAMTIENEPLPANPKTSALTVYSIVRAIRNATGTVVI